MIKIKITFWRKKIAIYCEDGSEDNADGIATLYALDYLEFEPRWG